MATTANGRRKPAPSLKSVILPAAIAIVAAMTIITIIIAILLILPSFILRQ